MPPTLLSTPRSGQIELQKWIDQGGAIATVDTLDNRIQPQQDMLEFQQRRFWMNSTLSLATGQKSKWVVTVPDKEAWEIDLITLIQGDTADHDYEMIWRAPDSAPFIPMVMWHHTVDFGRATNIFPTRNAFNITNSRSRFEFTGRMKLGPNEEIQITSEDPTSSVPNITERLSIKAHQIPIPLEAAERDLIVGSIS